MKFEDKIKTMGPKEFSLTMVRGLEKRWVKINMATFGETDGEICYGCAATNALCEMLGEAFDASNINVRYRILDIGRCFLYEIESAWDSLRKGDICKANKYLLNAKIHWSLPMTELELPILSDNYTQQDLEKYKQYAESI